MQSFISNSAVQRFVLGLKEKLTKLDRSLKENKYKLKNLLKWNDPKSSSSDRSIVFRSQSKLRSILRMPFILNFSKIEIELTTLCNLSCNNCDRSCGQAKSSEEMSIQQIRKFLDESIMHGKKWCKIVIQGGEPLLHSDIFKILDMFVEYKKSFSPSTFLRLTTNGWGPKVNRSLKYVPSEICVVNTKKIPLNKNGRTKVTGQDGLVFDTAHLAPMDLDDLAMFEKFDYRKGCSITEKCGMALTRYGFFPCGAGASVARVFGLDLGVKSLELISRARFRDNLDQLCRRCGHFKSRSRYVFPDSVVKKSHYQITSRTWHDALSNYKHNKKIISVY